MGYLEIKNIEDLIFNRSFRDWVIDAGSPDAAAWENWRALNPDKSKMVNDAKAIIYALQLNYSKLSEEEIEHEIQHVLTKIKDPLAYDLPIEEPRLIPFYKRRSFITAAAFVILSLGIASFYLFTSHKTYTDQYSYFQNKTKSDLIEEGNTTDTTKRVLLPDGSQALLEPKSRLSYSQNFSGVNREVYLTGEAFFLVTKNAARPFLVYTKSITTKVLGTSFRVKAWGADKNAIVTVKTGKVSVFKSGSVLENTTKPAIKGIVVTPNQEITYNEENNLFNKTIIAAPLAVSAAPTNQFHFDNTPASKVFKMMQEVYSIPIMYDEETLSSCSLSASFGNEPFYDKLNIVCKAINARYEIIDGNVIIVSTGCK